MSTMNGSRILGSLRATDDSTGVVRMEDRFETDIEDLWSALTNPQRLARWYGEVEGDLRVGGTYRIRIPDAWEGTGRVEECEPPNRLLVRSYDDDPRPGQPEESVSEVHLTADGDHTILVLEDRGLPRPLLPAYGAGIQLHFENLAAYLEGGQRGDAEGRWTALMPAYEALATQLGGTT